jgi:hypothetical protein
LNPKYEDTFTPNALKTPFLDFAGLGKATTAPTPPVVNSCTIDVEVKEAI